MGLLEREKKYPMIFDIPILLCRSTQMSFYDWRATVVRWLLMPFSQDFLVLPVKKSDMGVKNKRQLNLTHHKQEAQEIQSLENFVSMAIQGTQVPMYTKHTQFLYFSNFSIFLFLY